MEKFRTGRLAARSWQIEDLPLAMELWGDPAVTALIDSRGKLTEAQVYEKLNAEIERERSSGVPILMISSVAEIWPRNDASCTAAATTFEVNVR
jgi:hypothetical protein